MRAKLGAEARRIEASLPTRTAIAKRVDDKAKQEHDEVVAKQQRQQEQLQSLCDRMVGKTVKLGDVRGGVADVMKKFTVQAIHDQLAIRNATSSQRSADVGARLQRALGLASPDGRIKVTAASKKELAERFWTVLQAEAGVTSASGSGDNSGSGVGAGSVSSSAGSAAPAVVRHSTRTPAPRDTSSLGFVTE